MRETENTDSCKENCKQFIVEQHLDLCNWLPIQRFIDPFEQSLTGELGSCEFVINLMMFNQ